MKRRSVRGLLAAALVLASVPASAQFQSDSYKFLQAVRDAKNEDVMGFLDKPGTRIVDTQDRATGETALHIAVKRSDRVYTSYFLGKGANPNVRDATGATPLLLAVRAGAYECVDLLTSHGANVNLGNSGGVTPLILAVQMRDLALVRKLLAAGANPDQPDSQAGFSARDYAKQDTRSPAIAKEIAAAPKQATRSSAAVAGPKF